MLTTAWNKIARLSLTEVLVSLSSLVGGLGTLNALIIIAGDCADAGSSGCAI